MSHIHWDESSTTITTSRVSNQVRKAHSAQTSTAMFPNTLSPTIRFLENKIRSDWERDRTLRKIQEYPENFESGIALMWNLLVAYCRLYISITATSNGIFIFPIFYLIVSVRDAQNSHISVRFPILSPIEARQDLNLRSLQLTIDQVVKHDLKLDQINLFVRKSDKLLSYCSWSVFEMYPFTWSIFETCP